MWAYGAYISSPAGCLPRNGDSDRCGSGYSAPVTAYFNRSDWTYVHSNGQQGSAPAGAASQGPSSAFPWAGQFALRSSYAANATWLWWDAGPYGSSYHGHRDKLGLALHSQGAMLLVDSGRFAYAGSDLSHTLRVQYAFNASAHNTVALDGADQLPLPPTASAPLPPASYTLTPTHDAAYARMDQYAGLGGRSAHSRAVHYNRGGATAGQDFAVVLDRLEGSLPRALTTYWHSHPNATGVGVAAGSLVGQVGGVVGASGAPAEGVRLCLVPAVPAVPGSGGGEEGGGAVGAWARADIVRGQMRNDSAGLNFQGWYSNAYDDAWPASVLVYSSAPVPVGTVFGWLLVPLPASSSAQCSDMHLQLSQSPGEADRWLAQCNLAGAATTVTVALGGQVV